MLNRILISLFFLLQPLHVAAQGPEDVLSHRILPGWTQKDGTQMAALELILAPGWKTYWRAPGDAGIPPSFDWSRARNIKSVQIHWPTPEVFWQSGMRSVGYKDRIILPLTVTRRKPGTVARLRGRLELGICKDICIPHQIRIDATLPASPGKPSPVIAAALADMPLSASEARLRNAVCTLTPTQQGLAITARLTLPSTGGKEDAVIEPPAPGIWVSEPTTTRDGQTLTLTAEMIAHHGGVFAINRRDIRITVLGSAHAVDIQGCKGG